MLEHLLNFNLLTWIINPSQPEFWIKKIRDDGESLNDIFANLNLSVDYSHDQYTDYISTVVKSNKSSNAMFNLIYLIIDNEDNLIDGILSGSSIPKNVAIFLVQIIPIFMKEMYKFCSRLYNYNLSFECTGLRNMTLNDNNFNNDNTMHNLFFEKIFNKTISESEVKLIYYFFDTYIDDFSYKNQTCILNYNDSLNLFNNTEDIIFEKIGNIYYSTCEICLSLCSYGHNLSSIEIGEIVKNPVRDILYSSGVVVSIVFLLLTIIAFTIIPSMRSKMHDKFTMFHLISMTSAYICLALVQLYLPENFICISIGHIMQFGFLAMFFWLNVMCFDILLAFCFLRNRKSCLRNERRETIKLVWYCCYGWGGPTIILILTFFMEYSDILDPENYLKPVIGGPKCFFQNLETQWLFLYGPIGCLILANLVMFTITALTIFRHSRSSDVLQTSDNSVSTRNDNSRLKVYINLFILMGANWATEALGWALPRNDWVFYVTDVTTTLQGLLVFVLFVCKPRVIRELRTKFGCPQRPNENEGVRFKTSFSSNKSTGQTQLTQSLDEK